MNILIDGQTFNTPELHRGIGTYIKQVINNMLKIDAVNTWYICVSDSSKLSELDPWVQEKLNVIIDNEFSGGIDYSHNRLYRKKIDEIVEQYHIDILWIPNGLMVNVFFLDKMPKCQVMMTVYDLIPMIFPISSWSDVIKKEYYRRIDFLKQNDIELVFISDSAAADYCEYVRMIKSPNVVKLAADIQRFYRERSKQFHSDTPYILFTGGFDYRKNIDGAIKAYAMAQKKYCEDKQFGQYKLIIVGAYNEETKNKYELIIDELKMRDKIILTGYVSDEKLALLYQEANVFFFPSLYEGFGLPILEAMLGGAYILSADNSSLPEVCGEHALLCNADDVSQMADRIYDAYVKAKSENDEDIYKRQEYAKTFSWEKTAEGILKIINRNEEDNNIHKLKLAVLTPWAPMETGIANYMYKIVPYLRKYFHVSIYTDTKLITDELYNYDDPIEIYDIDDFSNEAIDISLFEIGNNSQFHKKIFDFLMKYGGTAEIHDYVLTPFFYDAYFMHGEKTIFKKLLIDAYGLENGEVLYQETIEKGCHPNVLKYPMCEAIINKSEKLIFHNHWSKSQIINNENLYVIPLACFDKNEKIDNQKINELLKKISFDNEIIIGCFGWLNSNKRPQIIINAVNQMIKNGYKVKLCFWGESNSDITELIKKNKMINNVYISGYLDEELYHAALDVTDIVINLRYPSMGESSATLCESLKYGKAVIVSDLNQYKEFPDEICWKLPVSENEEVILVEYLQYLVDNHNVKETLQENAKNYADEILSPEKMALLYYKYLTNGVYNEKR